MHSDRTKEFLLRLSEDEYQDLVWLSIKIDKGISETLRGLIPRYHKPSGEILSEGNIKNADAKDAVQIKNEFDRDQLKSLLLKLRETSYAVTLCREIEMELIENHFPHLSFPVYKRLSRWISPNRFTKREQTVKPIATQISQLLFGKIIERVD